MKLSTANNAIYHFPVRLALGVIAVTLLVASQLSCAQKDAGNGSPKAPVDRVVPIATMEQARAIPESQRTVFLASVEHAVIREVVRHEQVSAITIAEGLGDQLDDDGLKVILQSPSVCELGILDAGKLTSLSAKALGAMKAIKSLVVHRTSWDDAALRSLALSESIQKLVITSAPNLGDGGVEAVLGMKQLTLLWLEKVPFTGARFSQLELKCTAIETVFVDQCPLVENGFCVLISNAKSLQTLSISKSPLITDAGVMHLHQAVALRNLGLVGTGCSVEVVKQLVKLEPVEFGTDIRLSGSDVGLVVKISTLRRLTIACPDGAYGEIIDVLAKCRTLERIGFFFATDITDQNIGRLAETSATEFQIGECPNVTQAGLRSLEGMRSGLRVTRMMK